MNKNLKKTISIIIIIFIIGVIIYALFLKDISNKVTIEKISLDKNEVSIYVGEIYLLNAEITPKEANQELIWSSSNTSVATVNNFGIVSAISEGEADIIVSNIDNSKSDLCHIKVIVREVEKIELLETNITLKVGDTKRISATITPSDADNPVLNFSSNDSSIVTVDQNGVLIGKNAGNVVITVTSANGKVSAICDVTVIKESIPVANITLDKSEASLDIGKYLQLTATITPSDADNQKITWSSSNSNVATVDQNGIVTAKKSGTATINVKTIDGEKTATCTIVVKSNPIVPSNIYKKYESDTLKWYIQKTTYYYLTYIWMEDPYNQIKKLEANTAAYGKIYTDDELDKAGLSPVRRDVGQMMNAYISNGMISVNKSAIGYNASAFYVNGVWNPPIPFYHNRADSWIDLQDGILTRARFDDGINTHAEILGIDKNGNLIDYGNSVTKAQREEFYKKITSDKTKNTWTSTPILIKNGTNISYESDAAHRQAICQVDSNNYVMLTTIYTMGLHQVGEVFENLGCINAYNLDGGGSTSFFYKMPGDISARQIKCSDGKNGSVCRTIIEGIYFTEE